MFLQIRTVKKTRDIKAEKEEQDKIRNKPVQAAVFPSVLLRHLDVFFKPASRVRASLFSGSSFRASFR